MWKALWMVAIAAFLSGVAQAAELRPLPSRLNGVTIDSVSRLSDIVVSLDSLNVTPVTRIVFDEFVPATDYARAVTRIAPVSYIMGELLDSSAVKQYTVEQYKARTTEYLNQFGNTVDIWEIGNEINGEWLGSTASVVAKMTSAFDVVKARGGRTALTLYLNPGCYERAANEMFRWTTANVPERMKSGLDYVLVSYYEDDCNGFQPNWQNVFDRLGTIFPNSLLGVGECGTTRASRKESYIRRYYGMQINHPRFVGGWFWWYFRQDGVPKTKPLWPVFNSVMK